MSEGTIIDSHQLICIYMLSQLLERELDKCYRLVVSMPMNMDAFYGKSKRQMKTGTISTKLLIQDRSDSWKTLSKKNQYYLTPSPHCHSYLLPKCHKGAPTKHISNPLVVNIIHHMCKCINSNAIWQPSNLLSLQLTLCYIYLTTYPSPVDLFHRSLYLVS